MHSERPPETPPSALSRGLVGLMALATGASAGSLYFNQPLLGDMARALQVEQTLVGLVPTVSQVGYALGLLLLVPLGDSLERRRTIVTTAALTGLMLAVVALAPSFPWLLAASLAAGVFAVSAQLLIPAAVHLAPASQRGRVVGQLMSGLLIGCLLARTAAGFIGTHLGWRAVFVVGALLLGAIALALRLALPLQKAHAPLPYGRLLASLPALVRELPQLRLHALLGSLSFGTFTAFWATLALHLERLPGHYGPQVAGLFGVVGVAGALAAPLIGRRADGKGGDRRINVVALGAVLVAWGVMALWGGSLVGLAVGVVLLDLGAQSNHLSNQTIIYALRPEARSRLNTVYMVTYFVGGASGAALGTAAFARFGWGGVCALGAALAAVGLLVLATGGRRREEEEQGAEAATS